MVSSYGEDVLERYVLTKTDRGWIYEYKGQHERPLAAGEQHRVPQRDEVTVVAGGPVRHAHGS